MYSNLVDWGMADKEGNVWDSIFDKLSSLRDFFQKEGLFEGLSYASDNNIKTLQDRLNEHRDSPLKVDGDFGSGTAKALFEYIKENPSSIDDAHFTFLRRFETKLPAKELIEFNRLFAEKLDAPTLESIIRQNNGQDGSLLDPKMIAHLKNRPQARVIAQKIIEAANDYNVDSGILANQFWQESRLGYYVTSSAGAKGITQFIPSTGAKYGLKTDADFFDMDKSIVAGAHHMQDLHKEYGNYEFALAAYNGGPGSISHVTNRYIAIGQSDKETPERWFATMHADNYARGITKENQSSKKYVRFWSNQTRRYVEKIMPRGWSDEKRDAALAANTITQDVNQNFLTSLWELTAANKSFVPRKVPESYILPQVPAGISFAKVSHRIQDLEKENDTRSIQHHLADADYIKDSDIDGKTGPTTRNALKAYIADQTDGIEKAFKDIASFDMILVRRTRKDAEEKPYIHKEHHLNVKIDAAVALAQPERLKALADHLTEAGFPVDISQPGHMPTVVKSLRQLLTSKLGPIMTLHPSLVVPIPAPSLEPDDITDPTIKATQQPTKEFEAVNDPPPSSPDKSQIGPPLSIPPLDAAPPAQR